MVERSTPLTIHSLGVVTTITHQRMTASQQARRRVAATCWPAGRVHPRVRVEVAICRARAHWPARVGSGDTAWRVSVTLATTADREVRQSIESRLAEKHQAAQQSAVGYVYYFSVASNQNVQNKQKRMEFTKLYSPKMVDSDIGIKTITNKPHNNLVARVLLHCTRTITTA